MARPNLSYLKNLILALTGVAAGLWSGFSGMGAAPALAPTLAWLIGLRDRRLSAAVLTVTTVAALAALLAYTQMHLVWLAGAFVFAVASVAGSILGSIPALLPLRSSRSAQLAVALLTISLGAYLAFAAPKLGGPPIGALSTTPMNYQASLATLAAGGFVSGILSAAADLGGALAVPALLLICGEPPLIAQATALTVLVLASVLPVSGYIGRREVPLQAGFWCSLGALLGALAGSRMALAHTGARLALVYGIGLIVLGVLRVALSLGRRPQPAVQATAPPQP